MIRLVMLAVLFAGFSAQARTINLRNDEAKNLMEAAILSGFPALDVEPNIKRAAANGVYCLYDKLPAIDVLVASATCYWQMSGVLPPGGALALLQNLRKYGKDYTTAGFPGYRVDGFQCDYRKDNGKFTCIVVSN